MMWSISFFNSFCFTPRLRLFEIAFVFVRLDHGITTFDLRRRKE
jgi:hypothetical protein